MEGISYGETRKTYDINFKKKVVDLHLKIGMDYNTIARKMDIDKNQEEIKQPESISI